MSPIGMPSFWSKEPANSFDNLVDDMMNLILKTFLDIPSLCRFSLTCKAYYKLYNDKEMFAPLKLAFYENSPERSFDLLVAKCVPGIRFNLFHWNDTPLTTAHFGQGHFFFCFEDGFEMISTSSPTVGHVEMKITKERDEGYISAMETAWQNPYSTSPDRDYIGKERDFGYRFSRDPPPFYKGNVIYDIPKFWLNTKDRNQPCPNFPFRLIQLWVFPSELQRKTYSERHPPKRSTSMFAIEDKPKYPTYIVLEVEILHDQLPATYVKEYADCKETQRFAYLAIHSRFLRCYMVGRDESMIYWKNGEHS